MDALGSMDSLPLLVVCQHCDQSWVTCGGFDYGDMSVCCGSCMLATELQHVRVYLRRWFLAVLDPYCCEVVAEFLVGSKLWLQKRMKHELRWPTWLAKITASHLLLPVLVQ